MFDDEFERNTIPDEYTREELFKMAKENFKKAIKAEDFKKEYEENIKKNSKLFLLWNILTGYKVELPKSNSKQMELINIMVQMVPNKINLNNWKEDIISVLKVKTDPDQINVSAIISILIAEHDLVIDKDFQKEILSYKKEFEDNIAQNGLIKFQGYIVHYLMVNKLVEELYDATFLKDFIYNEIEKIEKEPLPI